MKRMRTILRGQKAIIYNVAFSPNGRSLLSPSDYKSVRIWNIRDGSSRILPVTGSTGSFMSVVFSPDGRYAAAGNNDDSLWIWELRTLRLVAKWRGHRYSVWSVVFTADGKGLMSGHYDKVVKYWDVSLLGNRRGVSTGLVVHEDDGFPLVQSFLGHSVRFVLLSSHNADWGTFLTQDCVRSIALFPNNTQCLVTSSDDTSVRVWDIESGVCQLTLKGHTNWVRGVDLSRTQNFLATAGEDRRVMVWKYALL